MANYVTQQGMIKIISGFSTLDRIIYNKYNFLCDNL